LDADVVWRFVVDGGRLLLLAGPMQLFNAGGVIDVDDDADDDDDVSLFGLLAMNGLFDELGDNGLRLETDCATDECEIGLRSVS
jgi:hypothetical protein